VLGSAGRQFGGASSPLDYQLAMTVNNALMLSFIDTHHGKGFVTFVLNYQGLLYYLTKVDLNIFELLKPDNIISLHHKIRCKLIVLLSIFIYYFRSLLVKTLKFELISCWQEENCICFNHFFPSKGLRYL